MLVKWVRRGFRIKVRLASSGSMRLMQLTIRLLRETDGRWIGDIPEPPGVTV